jgi:hypothetical protein
MVKLMRLLLGVLVIALPVLLASACGSTRLGAARDVRHATALVEYPRIVNSTNLVGDDDDDDPPLRVGKTVEDRVDADSDSDLGERARTGYTDEDDGTMLEYGHAAGPGDARRIVTQVERYYAAAAAENGAVACALMLIPYADNVPMDYGKGAGPRYSKGDTCAVVMTKTFAHFHRTLVGPVVITGVRVKGDQAIVLIGSKTISASYFSMTREGTRWTVDTMVASSMP